MDTKVLNDIGLSQKEVKTYMALLKLKSAPVTRVARESGVDRSQSYDVLEKLMRRGLASYVIKSSTKHFSPADPREIYSDFKRNETQLKHLVPELSSLFSRAHEDTAVELFKEKEGVKAIMKLIAKSGYDYDMIGSPTLFETTLGPYAQQYLREIERKGMRERILCTRRAKFHRVKRGEYRSLSTSLYSPADMLVFRGHVAIIIWSEPCYGILIKNEGAYLNYKKYFDFLWKIGDPL